ncbi:hypothetical protein [Tsukamurella pseudospumae]|uniref:DUF222 domain-containing protein n=1 Tax=Tsukamurella pseudospumae TaxID=239498 RepID=A0A137ZRQ1_9ACTN|nr:hypothetical protein [Tsukamurella pseudospumae]KXP00882.1 hypothetical protein AXK61_12805 [Tsukamurella pseudospumae]
MPVIVRAPASTSAQIKHIPPTLGDLVDEPLADVLAIATDPQETPVTTPEPPLDELDQTARDYLAHPGAQRQTAWLIVDRLNQERKRLHRELAEAQLELAEARRPVHSPGWYRTMTTDAATERYGFPAPDCYPLEHTATDGSKWFLDQGGKGWTLSEYMDDDTHLLKVWEQNLLDGARVLAGGMEQERTVLTPDGMRIVVVTGDELDRLAAEIRAEATVVDAQVHEDCCGEHGTPTGLRWAADEVEQSMRDEWENAPQLAAGDRDRDTGPSSTSRAASTRRGRRTSRIHAAQQQHSTTEAPVHDTRR